MAFFDKDQIPYEEYKKRAKDNTNSIIKNDLWIPKTELKIDVTTFNLFHIPSQLKQIAKEMHLELSEFEKFDKKLFLNRENHESLRGHVYQYIQNINDKLYAILDKVKIWLIYNHNLDIVLENFIQEIKVDRNMTLRAMRALFNTTFVGPKRVLIDPTIKCNLDCYYCRSHSPFARNLDPYKKVIETSDEFRFDYVKDNIQDLKNMGVEQLCIVGGGEPLAYKEFFPLLNLIADYGFVTNFSTNGLLLNPKK